ncbi:hypothetical protein SPFL3102_01496 [Sporomusaceae bacterium FL31]|nr:hypothetical protein SPFL3101_03129 [Sporomusaceae bacterium FL31]GCE33688.1 hypothetical protein SPFL3102_01496 [Sporomusaceae bacterium]
MTQAKGFMGRLCVDFESSFGTNPTTKAPKSLPFNNVEIVAKQALIDSATIQATRNPQKPGLGRVAVDGSITIPMDLNAIGYWFKGMFGSVVPTGSGPYSHVWKAVNSQPSMVIEKGFTDINQYFIYNGCKINSFKLPFGGDGELVATAELMGATEMLSSTQYAVPTVIALERVSNYQASLKEGGATVANVLSGELNIGFGLDGGQYTIGNSNCRGDIPEGILAITGTIKALFQDASLINKGINGTESSLELILENGTKSLSIKLPEIQYERTSPTITGPAGITLDLAFRGFYGNDPGNSAVIVTLVNQTPSY